MVEPLEYQKRFIEQLEKGGKHTMVLKTKGRIPPTPEWLKIFANKLPASEDGK